jgi:hypothetical protein
MISQLKILQYNVHTTEDIVMAPLLAATHISEFSVLAIQELWRNPQIPTTHNPSNSAFHLLYPPSAETSVCFFVNKSLNPSSYTAHFPTPKYGNLRLRRTIQGMRYVMIHNMYRTGNLSPTSSENLPIDEPLLLDTHEIFSMFLLPFPTILLIMYCLGTSTFTIPIGGDPELDPIVLHSFSSLFKSCTTSPYSYPSQL